MGQRTCTIDGCEKPLKASRGMCWMHYYRWRRHGDPHNHGAFIVGDVEARFWSKVERSGLAFDHRPDLGPCWLWTGDTNRGGYGVLRVAGRMELAHRWAYKHFIGPVPGDRPLDHLCRVRHCVNYARHLEPVTDAVNIARSPIHYGARTHCKNGHEFTPENTLPRGDGGRRCRICKSRYGRATQARKRAAAV